MGELVDMAAQFRGLPMGDLIGAPLQASCDAQLQLARASASFIKTVGFLPAVTQDAQGNEILDTSAEAIGEARLAKFKFVRPVKDPADPTKTIREEVELDVPMLAIVKIPALQITNVDITFDMEVKSSFKEASSKDESGKLSADMKVGWGPFSLNVHVEGSVSAHQEQMRTSDSSAKYHVEVKAADGGMPEGLARVLDIMHSAIAPMAIEQKAA